jgi:hypothetical protein
MEMIQKGLFKMIFFFKELLSLLYVIVLTVALIPLLIIQSLLGLLVLVLRRNNLPETSERRVDVQVVGKDGDVLGQEIVSNEDWSSVDQEQLVSALKERDDTHPELFRGNVRFGYNSDAVKSTNTCPRCASPTRQHYSNFIYATQIEPRVMFAPAGYFCSRCPTVIVDEAMITKGIKRRFQYKGVLGIEAKKDGSPEFFRKWNGRDAVYVLDENENPMGIATGDEIAPEEHPPIKRSRGTQTKSLKRSRTGKKNRNRKQKKN